MKFLKKIYNSLIKKRTIPLPIKTKKMYISPSELNKKSKKIFEPIPELIINDTNGKNILVMDDDFSSTEYVKQDILFLFSLSKKLKENKFVKLTYDEQSMISDSTPLQLKMLKSINSDNYNIITAKGNMAAFSIINAIKDKKIKNIDVAILDIILGGFKIENDNNIIYDGLDVAELIWNTYKSPRILFYTGCTVGKYSDEAKKFRDIFPDRGEIFNYIVYKDLNINFRRFQFLDLLCKVEGCNE